MHASADLEGDDAAGAKTGEAVTPRALGFEQILATDFNVDKFPAPGEWYISLSAADSDILAGRDPGRAADRARGHASRARPQASSPDFAAKLARPDAGADRHRRVAVEALLVGRRGRRATRR